MAGEAGMRNNGKQGPTLFSGLSLFSMFPYFPNSQPIFPHSSLPFSNLCLAYRLF
jgi:hypothetical protein